MTDNVVPLRQGEWAKPDWLPTGEALVREWMVRHGADFRYIDSEGQWYHFVDGCWRLDQRRMVNCLCAQLCIDIGSSKKRSLRMKLEAPRTISGIAGRAKDECAEEADAFDHHPAINTPSGEWTGPDTVHDHVREHYHSKITGARGPVSGDPVHWLRFLKKIMNGNQALIDYLQRVAGYCCSTSNAEQVLICFFGEGQNGKSVFLKTLSGILGSYAATASIETFLASKFDRHPEELAAFRGVRLVVASEPEESRAWNETMIKQITGGEKLRARFMRQNSFEFLPLFKIIVAANHKPRLHSTDKAVRRRFHIVPFLVEIPDDEVDRELADKLVAEWPQIFAWMLAGLDAWRVSGLAPPEEVVAATDEYISEQDTYAEWLEDRCSLVATAVTPSADLYGDWKVYAEKRGQHPRSMKALVAYLRKKGFLKDRSKSERGITGIMLKPQPETAQRWGYDR